MKDVVIGIINKDSKLLMVKRVKDDGIDWSFPSGKVEDGETLEEACIREVKEESGINVEIIEYMGNRKIPNSDIKISYFLCKYLNGSLSISDYNEISEVEFKNKKQLEQDIKTDIFEPVKRYIKTYIK